MGYQHEHDNARASCAKKLCVPRVYRVQGNNCSACHFLVNQLERLHAVSLPISLFKLERKQASCYRDLSETYMGTGHDFGE